MSLRVQFPRRKDTLLSGIINRRQGYNFKHASMQEGMQDAGRLRLYISEQHHTKDSKGFSDSTLTLVEAGRMAPIEIGGQ